MEISIPDELITKAVKDAADDIDWDYYTPNMDEAVKDYFADNIDVDELMAEKIDDELPSKERMLTCLREMAKEDLHGEFVSRVDFDAYKDAMMGIIQVLQNEAKTLREEWEAERESTAECIRELQAEVFPEPITRKKSWWKRTKEVLMIEYPEG